MAVRTMRMTLLLPAVGALLALGRSLIAVLAALTFETAVRLERDATAGGAAAPAWHAGAGLSALQRFRCLDEIVRERRDVDLLAGQPLDIAQQAALIMRAEGDGLALGARARGAADAVDILLRHFRQDRS